MIVLYTDTCLTCKSIKWVKDLQTFCKQCGVDFQQKRVFLFTGWQHEADQIMSDTGYSIPLLYNTQTNEAYQMDVKKSSVDTKIKRFILK